MNSLNNDILEYTNQIKNGQIQRAYKGIMTFMSEMRVTLEKSHPDYNASSLYYGYLDMTYFAFTPETLKREKLKIALVYLHEQNRFELWLGGINRTVQAEVIKRLTQVDMGDYKLSRVQPGIDSIIESIIVDHPDFDNVEALKNQIEAKLVAFAKDMAFLITQIS